MTDIVIGTTHTIKCKFNSVKTAEFSATLIQ